MSLMQMLEDETGWVWDEFLDGNVGRYERDYWLTVAELWAAASFIDMHEEMAE